MLKCIIHAFCSMLLRSRHHCRNEITEEIRNDLCLMRGIVSFSIAQRTFFGDYAYNLETKGKTWINQFLIMCLLLCQMNLWTAHSNSSALFVTHQGLSQLRDIRSPAFKVQISTQNHLKHLEPMLLFSQSRDHLQTPKAGWAPSCHMSFVLSPSSSFLQILCQ